MWLRINQELFSDFSKSFHLVMSIIRRVYHYQWQRNSTISTLSACDLELIWHYLKLDGIFQYNLKKFSVKISQKISSTSILWHRYFGIDTFSFGSVLGSASTFWKYCYFFSVSPNPIFRVLISKIYILIGNSRAQLFPL